VQARVWRTLVWLTPGCSVVLDSAAYLAGSFGAGQSAYQVQRHFDAGCDAGAEVVKCPPWTNRSSRRTSMLGYNGKRPKGAFTVLVSLAVSSFEKSSQ